MTGPGKYAFVILEWYIVAVERSRHLIVLSITALFILAAVYTANNLGMNTDTKDMLSPQLYWRQLDLAYEQHFPQYDDIILVAVQARTPDQAADAAGLLYARLEDESDYFYSAYYPRSLSLFRENALLFLDEADLYALSDNLAAIQPFLARLTDDMTLRGLLYMLGDAIEALEDGETINLEPLLIELRRGIDSVINGAPQRVSWQNLIDSDTGENGKKHYEFIVVQPRLDEDALLPANRAIDRLRELIADPAIRSFNANIRLSGDTVLTQEELLSVSRGTVTAVILALCMVTIIMISGLRSLRLVGFSLLSLVTGLVFTAAFATAAIGELNLISVAFAVLYIGLGIDFAIHYCLRYRELRLQGVDNSNAIEQSSGNLGQSLFICTLTTAIGFFAFIPTDYQGVAELGLISGVGMFISLFITLTLLPALLRLFPLKPVNSQQGQGIKSGLWLGRIPLQHAGLTRMIALLILVIAALLATRLRFDTNILNLQDPANESVQTYRDLLETSDTSPWTGIIVANDREDALTTRSKLEPLAVVDSVVWLEDFVPDNQGTKLAVIDELNLLMVGSFSGNAPVEPPDSGESLQILRGFISDYANRIQTLDNPGLERFMNSLQAYTTNLSSLSPANRAASLETLDTVLLASLPGRLSLLEASLDAGYVSVETLPDSLRQRWLSPANRYLLSINPAENLNNNGAMRRFVETVYAVDPRIIGPPVVNVRAGDAVMSAFREALAYALVAITLLLLLLLRRKMDTLLILASLLFAVIVTAGISVLVGLPLNFANIIALPLLLGMGVDSGIHILHRYRTALPDHHNILATSTARAVLVSALTTMCSIGNLAFSPHVGTASMGLLLSIGIGMTLVSTLLVLPVLLAKGQPDNRDPRAG